MQFTNLTKPTMRTSLLIFRIFQHKKLWKQASASYHLSDELDKLRKLESQIQDADPEFLMKVDLHWVQQKIKLTNTIGDSILAAIYLCLNENLSTESNML